jgi:3-(3-hydroxy-phenyl)propionate hydroxylase
VYGTPLSTPDAAAFGGSAKLGAPAPDAPMRARGGGSGFLLERLPGSFEVLHVPNGSRPDAPAGIKLTVIGEDLHDDTGMFAQRFDATPGATYLLRPDQHLCARWRTFDPAKIAAARDRAFGRG